MVRKYGLHDKHQPVLLHLPVHGRGSRLTKKTGTFCCGVTSQFSLPTARGTGFLMSSFFRWYASIKLLSPNSSTSFSLAPLNESDSAKAINWDTASRVHLLGIMRSLRKTPFNRGQFCCYHTDVRSSADSPTLAHQVWLLMAKPVSVTAIQFPLRTCGSLVPWNSSNLLD